MSVEAISWALNLAPVPRDRGGKPNPACKAVLIGLANHVAPDGKDTFPSEKTLARYTCLAKRTVQTALDRLEAGGIIRPCDPAVVAAKIKRADRRPQGWDLATHLIRGDLDAGDLAALERQFPGLTARVMTMRTEDVQVAGCTDHGVQQLHPNRPWNHPQNHPPPTRARARPVRAQAITGQGLAAARRNSPPAWGRAGSWPTASGAGSRRPWLTRWRPAGIPLDWQPSWARTPRACGCGGADGEHGLLDAEQQAPVVRPPVSS